MANRRIKTNEDFLKIAHGLHGDKFDYSKVVYVRHDQKVIIICNTCTTEFEQMPTSHITKSSKGGCPVCAKEHRRKGMGDWVNGVNADGEARLATEIPYKHWQLHDISKMNIH